jgi:putative membrane protein
MKATDLLLVSAAFAAGYALTGARAKQHFDLSEFIEEAVAKGIAEVETAKLVLQITDSTDIKIFAQLMIDDHIALNQELLLIAKRKNLAVADDAHLMEAARQYLLPLGEEKAAFDEDYVNHQLEFHKEAVELFRTAARSNDQDVRSFLFVVLGKLQHHLRMAEELVGTFHSNVIPTSNDQCIIGGGAKFVEEPNYPTDSLKH